MAMTKTAVYSKVRRVMKEAGKRQIWQKAKRILEKLSKEFGEHLVSADQDGTSIDQRLFIFTGKEHVSLERNVSDKRVETIKAVLVDFSNPRRSGSTLFEAKTVPNFERERVREGSADELRYIEIGKHEWIRVQEYHPSQWERVLEFHEAERLLKQAYAIQESARRKREAAQKKEATLTPEEEKLAKDFAPAKP